MANSLSNSCIPGSAPSAGDRTGGVTEDFSAAAVPDTVGKERYKVPHFIERNMRSDGTLSPESSGKGFNRSDGGTDA